MKLHKLHIALGLVVSTIAFVPSVSASELFFDTPSTIYVDTCQSVNINLNATQNVTGATTVISFPNLLMNVKGGSAGISNGAIFNNVVSTNANNVNGTALYTGYRLSNFTGTNTVNSLLFDVTAPGNATLNFMPGVGNTEIAADGSSLPVTLSAKNLTLATDNVKPVNASIGNTWYISPTGSVSAVFTDNEGGFHTLNQASPKVRSNITQNAIFTIKGFGSDFTRTTVRKQYDNINGSGITASLGDWTCGNASAAESYAKSATVSGNYDFNYLEYISGTLQKVQDNRNNEANNVSFIGRIQDVPPKGPVFTKWNNNVDPNVVEFEFTLANEGAVQYEDMTNSAGQKTHILEPKNSIVVTTQQLLPTVGSVVPATTSIPTGAEKHAVVEYDSNCDAGIVCSGKIRLADSNGNLFVTEGQHRITMTAHDEYYKVQQNDRKPAEPSPILPQWTEGNSKTTKTLDQFLNVEASCEPELISSPISVVLKPGQTRQLSVVSSDGIPGHGPRDVTTLSTFSSSNESIAVVDNHGLITAISTGGNISAEAIITVAYESMTAQTRVIVTSESTGGVIYVYPDAPIIYSGGGGGGGGTIQVVTVYNGSDITHETSWISSDPGTVTVVNGFLTAVRDGIARITASYNGQSAHVDVTVIGSDQRFTVKEPSEESAVHQVATEEESKCSVTGFNRATDGTPWVNQYGDPVFTEQPTDGMVPEIGGMYPVKEWWIDQDTIPHAVVNGRYNKQGKWYAITQKGWYDATGTWRAGENTKDLHMGWLDDFGYFHEGQVARNDVWHDLFGNRHVVIKLWKDDDCVTRVNSGWYDAKGQLHGITDEWMKWKFAAEDTFGALDPFWWILISLVVLAGGYSWIRHLRRLREARFQKQISDLRRKLQK